MAYDQGLAQRIRDSLPRGDWTEKHMFGGVAWLHRGNLVAGVLEDRLIARVGPEAAAALLSPPDVRPFDVTGRPMKGWLYVEAEEVADDDQLRDWIERALAFTQTLPAK